MPDCAAVSCVRRVLAVLADHGAGRPPVPPHLGVVLRNAVPVRGHEDPGGELIGRPLSPRLAHARLEGERLYAGKVPEKTKAAAGAAAEATKATAEAAAAEAAAAETAEGEGLGWRAGRVPRNPQKNYLPALHAGAEDLIPKTVKKKPIAKLFKKSYAQNPEICNDANIALYQGGIVGIGNWVCGLAEAVRMARRAYCSTELC